MRKWQITVKICKTQKTVPYGRRDRRKEWTDIIRSLQKVSWEKFLVCEDISTGSEVIPKFLIFEAAHRAGFFYSHFIRLLASFFAISVNFNGRNKCDSALNRPWLGDQHWYYDPWTYLYAFGLQARKRFRATSRGTSRKRLTEITSKQKLFLIYTLPTENFTSPRYLDGFGSSGALKSKTMQAAEWVPTNMLRRNLFGCLF